jgi:thioredoxin reductase/Pyruvate/2-oxoacid:ferredoxin oxidoreductase delta subunit
MEEIIEDTIIYSFIGILFFGILFIYLRKQWKNSKLVEEKIIKAKADGFYEPVSLHPVVDVNLCIQSGACITSCPEKDILGILNGKAVAINTSHCIGHGACFHACPTMAISLCIGTEKRGVDLPHVNQLFETNVPGIYIAGEIGGMGLIKNAVEQGKQVVENISKNIDRGIAADYDIIIVGAGPAGIAASLAAKKLKLSALVLEQDTIGGTVFTFPRKKIIMTSPMDIPLHGKVKLYETSKAELLDLWNEILSKNEIVIREKVKVDTIVFENNHFVVETAGKEKLTCRKVILSIGRTGTPRKLNIPGEMSTKVAYRLLEPELIENQKVVVVGGGDSAIETALLLTEFNQVILSYRGEAFGRIKPGNQVKIKEAMSLNQIDVRFNTSLKSIEEDHVKIEDLLTNEVTRLDNDLVYIFAGGELPTKFLESAGVQITKKFGEALMKH